MHSIHWMEISTFLVFDGHDSVVSHNFSDNSIIILFHVVRYIPLNPLKPPYMFMSSTSISLYPINLQFPQKQSHSYHPNLSNPSTIPNTIPHSHLKNLKDSIPILPSSQHSHLGRCFFDDIPPRLPHRRRARHPWIPDSGMAAPRLPKRRRR